MTAPLFEIEDLHVRPVAAEAGASAILDGVSLTVKAGEFHALMGPEGAGKSTLVSALLGSPRYEVTGGRILFKGDDISSWGTDVRGKAGLFLAFQDPEELAGVSVLNFLRQALSARKGIDMSVLELRLALTEWMDKLDMDHAFIERYVNEGFSVGEKKRNEVLQMAVLEPAMAVLDESDSGLDADALAAMVTGIRLIGSERPDFAVLAMSNEQRLLDQLQPDQIHVLLDGQVVASGGPGLARQLEHDGYESFR